MVLKIRSRRLAGQFLVHPSVRQTIEMTQAMTEFLDVTLPGAVGGYGFWQLLADGSHRAIRMLNGTTGTEALTMKTCCLGAPQPHSDLSVQLSLLCSVWQRWEWKTPWQVERWVMKLCGGEAGMALRLAARASERKQAEAALWEPTGSKHGKVEREPVN